jgi:hypothetical protein
MYVGMGLIIVGVGIAAYGLLPKDIGKQLAASQDIVVSPPEDAPLTAAHWKLMAVLVVALIIDVMKPASLGFTIPGMSSEYHAAKSTVSLVPFFALTGGSKRLLKIYTELRIERSAPKRFLVTFYETDPVTALRKARAVESYLQSLGVPPKNLQFRRTGVAAPFWVQDRKRVKITTTVDLVDGCRA